jgi:hypothetical protein
MLYRFSLSLGFALYSNQILHYAYTLPHAPIRSVGFMLMKPSIIYLRIRPCLSLNFMLISRIHLTIFLLPTIICIIRDNNLTRKRTRSLSQGETQKSYQYKSGSEGILLYCLVFSDRRDLIDPIHFPIIIRSLRNIPLLERSHLQE